MVYFLCKAYDSDRQNCYFAQSLPVRGAWIEMVLFPRRSGWMLASLPVRGAWIEISSFSAAGAITDGRSPCGERGLKFYSLSNIRAAVLSLPVRGAWIEMRCQRPHGEQPHSRSPCGERGLKSCRSTTHLPPHSRSPCGERGLKYHIVDAAELKTLSLPVRGAWIEILCAL